MPVFEYDQELLQKLRDAPFERQGAVGDPPATWAKEMGIEFEGELPSKSLTRQEVRKICVENANGPLFGYLCAMAWGAQGRGPNGSRPVKAAWRHRKDIEQRIARVRNDRLSRADAYDLFAGEKRVPGLGPAYFTKLLYFFCLSDPPDCYIMDQWTTKPLLLLTGENFIRHGDFGPTRDNRGPNYELFCHVVDDLAGLLGEESSERMEERLFSVGSIRRAARGQWRQTVVDEWKNRSRLPRYSRKYVEKALEKSRAIEETQIPS